MGVADERWLVISHELARELARRSGQSESGTRWCRWRRQPCVRDTRYVKSQMDLNPTPRIKERSDWLIKRIEKWTGDLRRLSAAGVSRWSPPRRGDSPSFDSPREQQRARFLSLVRDERNTGALISADRWFLVGPTRRCQRRVSPQRRALRGRAVDSDGARSRSGAAECRATFACPSSACVSSHRIFAPWPLRRPSFQGRTDQVSRRALGQVQMDARRRGAAKSRCTLARRAT